MKTTLRLFSIVLAFLSLTVSPTTEAVSPPPNGGYDGDTTSDDSGGTLVTPRSSHTATLLADGRVLLAGGYDGSLPATASSEIYNPATNTWTATGNLNQGRRDHGTVLLSDGHALSMGGSTTGDVSTVTNSAETYNPATGLWSITANMITARSFFDPVLLANGKVLVAGGHIAGFPFETASCELYDPATGTWSPTGSLLQPRTQYHATLLADGRVFVAGGFNQTAGLIAQSELYDPGTGTWSSSGSLTLPRTNNVQVRLGDGRVLVAGGIKEFGFESHPHASIIPRPNYSMAASSSPAEWRTPLPLSRRQSFSSGHADNHSPREVGLM